MIEYLHYNKGGNRAAIHIYKSISAKANIDDMI